MPGETPNITGKPAKRKTLRPRGKSSGKAKAETSASGISPADARPNVEHRRSRIELEAYLRAERRGFEPGHELEDWLAAENSVGARADV